MSSPGAPVKRPQGWPRVGSLLLAAAIVLAFAVRVRLAEMPLERDEGEYAYAGQLILQGVPPYAEACNMKLPGVYYTYALIMALFGETTRGVHLGLALWTTVSTLAMFLLARRLLGPWPAAAAGCTFAVLSLSPSAFALAAHANHFVLLPALFGLWLLAGRTIPSRLTALAAGFALGVAFLMKQQAVFLVLFGGLFTLWSLRREGWRSAFAGSGSYALGAVAPYAALAGYLWSRGVFTTFWFWTVTYARAYVSQVPLSAAWDSLMQDLPRVIGWNAGLWILAGAGGLALLLPRLALNLRVFLAGLTLFAAAAVCPGFRFMPHYFILLFPALSLLVAALLATLTERRAAIAGAAGLVAVLAVAIAGQREPLFLWSAPQVSKALYNVNPFAEAVEIGRYLGEHTKEGDRIGVLGSEPEIFFLAHRRAASRYVYIYALMEPHPYARRLQDEFVADIERTKPAFLVMVRVPGSWLRVPESETFVLEWAQRYLREHYDVTGFVDVFPDRPSEVYWDDATLGRHPASSTNVLVLRRRD